MSYNCSVIFNISSGKLFSWINAVQINGTKNNVEQVIGAQIYRIQNNGVQRKWAPRSNLIGSKLTGPRLTASRSTGSCETSRPKNIELMLQRSLGPPVFFFTNARTRKHNQLHICRNEKGSCTCGGLRCRGYKSWYPWWTNHSEMRYDNGIVHVDRSFQLFGRNCSWNLDHKQD